MKNISIPANRPALAYQVQQCAAGGGKPLKRRREPRGGVARRHQPGTNGALRHLPARIHAFTVLQHGKRRVREPPDLIGGPARSALPVQFETLVNPGSTPSRAGCGGRPEKPERGTVAETYVSGVAGRYATALLELAREAGAIDAVKADLDRFGALIAESDDLKRLVRSPVFSSEEQEHAVAAVLDKVGIGGLASNFFKTVAANRRLFAVEAIMRAFDALVSVERGEVVAEVTVAQPLSDAHAATLKGALDQMTGKSVQLAVTVDPSLLGGLKVKIGSRLVDASLKTKLNSIRTAMKEVR